MITTPEGGDASDRQLVVVAVGVLCRRHARGRFPHLTDDEADRLSERLLDVAADAHPADLPAAVALAHRLVAGDDPRASPLWPSSLVGTTAPWSSPG